MPQAVDSVASVMEQLGERVRDLERRVAVLEGQAERAPLPVSPVTLEPQSAQPSWSGIGAIESPAGVIQILGKAVLGFAGAFLLRAIAESTSFPRLPVLVVAILYACFWMLWAIRTHNSSRFAGVTYAITSALILSPLLWESTVRFQVLSSTVSALVLVAFIALTLALSHGRELQLIPWIATLAVEVTALALIIETHDLVPLTTALLAVAAATEVNAGLGHILTFRAIPALVADFSIWLLVYVLASGTVPEGYHPAAPAMIVALCVILPVIYGASIAVRSFVYLHRITMFETAQAAISFALATFGILRASNNSAAPALGAAFLLLAGICYRGTLSRFADEAHTRNRRVTANAAAALLLAATFLLMPDRAQVPFLCLASLLTTYVYTRTAKLSLGLHASFYIAAALAASPLPLYIANALAGSMPGAPEWRSWSVALTAAACYAIGSHRHADGSRRRLLWIVPAAVAAFATAAVSVAALIFLLSRYAELGASHLSMIRTIVICAVALVLGFASRWQRIELGWTAYATVAVGTLKLIFEDLRFGNPASLVVSFLFYGLILILLPKLTRERR